MGILVGSVIFGFIFGIIVPIIYFFRSKASVAVGWFLLGSVGAGIGSCVGVGEMAHTVAKNADKIQEKWEKKVDEAAEKLKQEIRKTDEKYKNKISSASYRQFN